MQATKSTSSFQVQEIANLFAFNYLGNLGTNYLGISTDSRNIGKDQIFVPLVGEKFDGHDFIDEVFEKNVGINQGEILSFCEISKVFKVKDSYRKKLILVENTLDAYHKLANYYREKVNPTVIAITGSSGKTTVKELVSSVLSGRYKTHKTEANFNNEIGVPKTILDMPQDTKMLVLELGMRKEGEIRYLSKTCIPDIAVITNVGTAHVGLLGTTQSIIKAKCEILEYLKKDGLAILCDDPALMLHSQSLWHGKTAVFNLNQVKNIGYKEGKTYFEINLHNKSNEKYGINALGQIQVLNALVAILVGKYCGLSDEEIQEGLYAFKLPSGRGNVIALRNNIYLIDESYNANPDSLMACVSNLINCWKEYKKFLVLGELAELGSHEERLLNELKASLNDKPLTKIITVGEKLKPISTLPNAICVRDKNECCAILKELVSPKSIVLVKGSHVAELDKVISLLKELWKDQR